MSRMNYMQESRDPTIKITPIITCSGLRSQELSPLQELLNVLVFLKREYFLSIVNVGCSYDLCPKILHFPSTFNFVPELTFR